MRFCLVVCSLLVLASTARSDAFDHYLNKSLDKLVESKNVKAVKKLSDDDLLDHDSVLPSITQAFAVVKTNGGRYVKVLLHAGKQKVGEKMLPIMVVDRYVCYKDGEEQTIQASGKNLALYAGFRVSFDLGQVVPEEVGGDLRFVVEKDKMHLEPLGKAKLWLVTKHDPTVTPKKGAKLVVGDKFEAKYFNGTFKLYDDGRRSGKVILKVAADNKVTGWYYSDKDGAKYEIKGKVGNPLHAIEFTVKFPRSEQTFKGMLFTGNGQALAGSSKLAERTTAFYAIRQE